MVFCDGDALPILAVQRSDDVGDEDRPSSDSLTSLPVELLTKNGKFKLYPVILIM